MTVRACFDLKKALVNNIRKPHPKSDPGPRGTSLDCLEEQTHFYREAHLCPCLNNQINGVILCD